MRPSVHKMGAPMQARPKRDDLKGVKPNATIYGVCHLGGQWLHVAVPGWRGNLPRLGDRYYSDGRLLDDCDQLDHQADRRGPCRAASQKRSPAMFSDVICFCRCWQSCSLATRCAIRSAVLSTKSTSPHTMIPAFLSCIRSPACSHTQTLASCSFTWHCSRYHRARAWSLGDLAIRYFAVGLIVIFIRGVLTEKIYLNMLKKVGK